MNEEFNMCAVKFICCMFFLNLQVFAKFVIYATVHAQLSAKLCLENST